MKTQLSFLTVIAMLLITFQSYAQQGEPKRPSVEERVTKTLKIIERKIEINESEKLVIRDAFKTFFESVDELMQPGQKPQKEIIEQYERARDTKVKNALTAEQYEEYLRISCMLRPKPRENQKGDRPPQQRP